MKKDQTTALDAIRAFYIAEELMSGIIRGSKKDDKKIRVKLGQAIKKVKSMPLQKLLTKELVNFGPRFDNYFNSTWTLKKIPLAECGVWPRMGGLPAAATFGSVVDTAHYIQPYLDGKKKMTPKIKRAGYIRKMGTFAEIISEYVPIIVLEGGVIRHNKLTSAALRKPYKHYKYDIDDGNHRAVSLALNGQKEILALVGKRKYKNDLLYFNYHR